MSQLWQDMRYAFRTLRSAPGFAAVAILTLAVGIGANAAIFSFVNGILLNPLPYPTADRIVRVLEKPPGLPTARNGISTLNYLDWEKQNQVLEYMAPQTGGNAVMTGSGDPVQLRGARVGVHYFDIFGMKAAQGRLFLPGEDQLGKEKVVVLSSVLWRDQFGSDPNIVGRKIILDGQPYTIIGVAGERLRSRRSAVLAAARIRTLQYDSQFPLVRIVGAIETRRDVRAGAAGNGCDRRTHSRRFPGFQQGLGRGARLLQEHFHQR